MKRIALLACVMMTMAMGCRAVDEGIDVFRGAEGVSAVIKPIDSSLGEYRRFEVVDFQDQAALGVPSVLKQTLPAYVAEGLADKKIPNESTGKTLRIAGTYIYYEDAKTVTEQVFGPFEEVLARVQFTDAQSGRVLGEAYCVGRSTTSVASGAENKAKGLAKAIVKLIDQRYPKR